MNRVLDNLYIGGVYDFRTPQALIDAGITSVITLYEWRKGYPSVPVGIPHASRPLPDGTLWDPSVFADITAYIHNEILAGNKVLVCCAAGKSRSATIVLAYLCTYGDMTLQQAWKHLKACRPVVDPHLELLASLVKFLGIHPYLSTLTGET